MIQKRGALYMAANIKKIIISAVLIFAMTALTVSVPFAVNDESFLGANWAEDADEQPESIDVDKVSGGELPVQPGVTADTAEYDLAYYEKAAETANAVLYADFKNGYFALKNKTSGKIWYSVPNDMLIDEITTGAKRSEIFSQIVLNYVFADGQYEITGAQHADSYTSCVMAEGGISVEKLSSGIRVVYRFEDVGVVLPVEYTLENDYLAVTVVWDQIKISDDCILMGINVLPSFGAGNSQDQGWLFVPDGSGAIVNFNNGIKSLNKYDKYVYCDELAIPKETSRVHEERILIPVFSTKVGNDTLTGIITNGDAAASIAYFNGNSDCGYNCISSVVHFLNFAQRENIIKGKTSSKISTADYNLKNYQVRYYMGTGENADIAGIAATYRDYLTSEKGFSGAAVNPTMNLSLYGFVETEASFLGIPYTKRKVLTTVDQALSILEELEKKGVTNVSVKYIGWSNAGVDNKKVPSSAKVSGKIGRSPGFAALAQRITDQGGMFYPEVDLLRYTKGGNGVAKTRDSIKTPFQVISSMHSYLPSNYEIDTRASSFYLLTPQKISKISDAYLKSYQKLNIDAIVLSTIGQLTYSNFSNKLSFNRAGLPDIYDNVLAAYQKAGVKTAFTNANAYVFGYADRIFEVPVQSSGFDSFDYDVPFYQMVLHGKVNMTSPAMMQSSNPTFVYLKSVEYGMELLYNGIYSDSSGLTGTAFYYLYSSDYGLWIDDAANKYTAYAPLQKLIYNSEIVSNIEIASGVKKTVYQNGVTVYVNYNDEAVMAENLSISPKSFAYKGAEG